MEEGRASNGTRVFPWPSAQGSSIPRAMFSVLVVAGLVRLTLLTEGVWRVWGNGLLVAVVVLVIGVLVWVRRRDDRYPMTVLVSPDFLSVPRPLRAPRAFAWSQVADVRLDPPAPWSVQVVAEMTDGEQVRVLPLDGAPSGSPVAQELLDTCRPHLSGRPDRADGGT